MAAVKASKQYQMVVVPWRPWYRLGIMCLFVLAMGLLSWATYRYGMNQGMALREEVVQERDRLQRQLAENESLVEKMRQEIADLRVGGEIDARANEEVRRTIESLQAEVTELKEEIRFYKGVMLPNVEETGLRIERLTMKPTGDPNRIEYSLLLTQVVEKHEYIQGGVQINLVGMADGVEKTLALSEVSGADRDTVGFRFRYFQNIDGVLTIPQGFEPRHLLVEARSSGGDSQSLEKRFQWQLSGG